MSRFPWTLAEIERRVAILRGDVASRRETFELGIDAQGIHRSQIRALDLMMDVLLQRQDDLLAQLRSGQSAQQFAHDYAELLTQISGANGLWRVFRYIFDQRRDPTIRPQLDAADLIAADCYHTCIEQARTWGLIDQEYREPPLVYLDAATSALTASRSVKVSALGMVKGPFRAQRLPIPIILLPVDQVNSCWLYVVLHHEVGHNLDQDLRPPDADRRLGEELQDRLIQQLSAAHVPLDRRRVWQRWSEEMLADAFGLLLGGVGFAYALTALLLPQLPLHAEISTDDAHPDNSLRIALIMALLRCFALERFSEAADWLQQHWQTLDPPAGLTDYLADVDQVADLVINTPLAALGGRPLRDLAPNLAWDAEAADNLATYLRKGFGRPQPETFPRRLVPAAAQIALTRIEPVDIDRLVEVHSRSMDYLHAIPRPQYLAIEARREAFLHRLSSAIQFESG